MSDEDVEVKFGASIEGVNAGISQVRELLKGLSEPINGIRENLGELAEAFIAAFAVEKIGEFAEQMADLGLQTTKAAQTLGISSQQVGGLGLIAKASGTDLQGLEMAFGRMSRNIIEGSDQTKRAFAALGTSMASFKSLAPEAQLETLATKFQGIKDGADKDAIAIALLGRAGEQLIPLLNQGPEAIAEWNKSAEELGVSLSHDVVEAMEATHKQLTLLGASFQGAGIQVFLEFKDVINGTAQIMRDLVSSFTNAMREGGFVKDTMDLIAGAARGLVTVFAGVIEVLKEVWDTGVFAVDSIYLGFVNLGTAIANVWKAVGAATDAFFTGMVTAAQQSAQAVGGIFVNLGATISAGLHGDLSGISTSFEKMKGDAASSGEAIKRSLSTAASGIDMSSVTSGWDAGNKAMVDRTQQYMSSITKDHQTAMAEIKTIWGTGDAAVEAEHEQHQAHMLASDKEGAKDRLEAAMKEIDGEIKALQTGLKQKTTILDAEVAQHQITQNAKFGALETYTQQEYEAELALLQKEMGLEGMKLAQKQEVLNKIKQLQAKHEEDMVKLDEQSIAASQKAWQGYFDTFQSEFNGQLKGLLAGTTSFAAAMKSIVGNLIVKLIEGAESWAFEWIAGELGMTTATTTGAATRSSAQVASVATSSLATVTAVLKSIAASAAEAFAGVVGFLSPVLGPAAVGPAAGVEATVMAAGAGIASHAVGSWALPSDMLSVVHQGEMIVPAAQTPWAQSLMANAAGGGSGGGDMHVHMPVTINGTGLTPQQLMSAIKQSANDVASVIGKTMGRNMSTRGAY